MLQDLKSRGLEDVIVFVSDELRRLKDALTDEFPLSKHQSCWTHILRNIANKSRAKDKSSVLEDLREVYKKKTIKEAKVKEQFPHEKYLEKYVSTYVSKYNTNFASRIHNGFNLAQYELSKC